MWLIYVLMYLVPAYLLPTGVLALVWFIANFVSATNDPNNRSLLDKMLGVCIVYRPSYVCDGKFRYADEL